MPPPTESVPTRSRLYVAAQRRLPVVHYVADSALWAFAIPAGVLLRYDFDLERAWQREVVTAVVVAVVLQGIFGFASGLYRRRWRYGSFDEVRIVALTALSVGLVMTILWWGSSDVTTRVIPRSVPLLATAISLLGQIAVRSMWRLYVEHRDRPEGDHLQRLLIVGAGSAAEQVLRTLRSSSDAPFLPVAMVDDDPRKRNLRMSGVKVEGTVEELIAVATRRHATAVLIAVPSADSPFIRRVTAATPTTPDSMCSSSRRSTRCSAGCTWPTSGRSTRTTCSADTPPTSIRSRCRSTSPAGGCWSREQVDRSAVSCAVS